MNRLYLCLILSFVCACASIDRIMTNGNTLPDEQARTVLVSKFPNLKPQEKQRFLEGKPWIGMTQEQFESLMGGKAQKSEQKLTKEGDAQIQLYKERVKDWKGSIVSKFYKVKILDGKLAEFQEIDQFAGNIEKY